MAKPKSYATATAFRRALEDRLKQVAGQERVALERLRREVAFDRLLARLFNRGDAPWVLKGGYALELRMKEARATKDIDLALRHTLGKEKGGPLNDAILEALQAAAALDLGDFFEFQFGGVMKDLDAAPYGGARFPVTARMDARVFIEFHLDVGAGDVVLTPFDLTQGRDWLGFAGISAPQFPTISREQHFAEKLHAYTIPRKTPNSRVRDLVDMILLIDSKQLDRRPRSRLDCAGAWRGRRSSDAFHDRRLQDELTPSPPPAPRSTASPCRRTILLYREPVRSFRRLFVSSPPQDRTSRAIAGRQSLLPEQAQIRFRLPWPSEDAFPEINKVELG